MATAAFTIDENASVNRLPFHARSAALTELWVFKEAALKAVGVGLLEPMTRLQISPQGRLAAWVSTRVSKPTGLLAWRAPAGYRGAVAFADATGRSHVVVRQWPESALDGWRHSRDGPGGQRRSSR